jgi:hypothetical protein
MNKLFLTLLTTVSLAAISLSASAAEQTGQTKAEYKAAKALADADYDASRVRCNDLAGNDRDVCLQKAKAARSTAKANAKANYEGTGEAKLEAREDTIEADYKVAKEKCDSLAGNAKDLCIAEAKANYAKEKATLEAYEKSMAADYKLAKERCSTLSGSARRACLKDAKIKFDD